MEEIKYKLENGNLAMKASAIYKLRELAVDKFRSSPYVVPVKPSSVSDHQFPELALLWREVKSKDQAISSLCCEVVVQLVEAGYVDGGAVLASMLASASQIHCPGGLIRTTSHLLKFVKTSTPFGISANQHPFVSLLRASPSSLWPIILQDIQLLIDSEPRLIKTLTPVFMFGLCNPHEMEHLSSFRQSLAKILVKFRDIDEVRVLTSKVLEWQMYDTALSFTESAAIVMDHMGMKTIEASDVLLIFSLSLRASMLGLSPRLFLRHLHHQRLHVLDVYSANVLCVMIGRYISEAPFESFQTVVELATNLIKDFNIDQRIVGLVMVPVIELTVLPKALRDDLKCCCTKLIEAGASKLFNAEMTVPFTGISESKYDWDPIISSSRKTASLLLEFGQSQSKSISWLNRLATGRFSNTIETVFAVACSLLLTSNDRRLLDLSLSQMLRITKENARLSSSGMSVVFFKMANLSTCEPQQSTPECIYSLMTALPNFANDKCCVIQVLNLILKLNTGSNSLPLLYNLWLVEERCFPHLLKALEQPGHSLTKAKVVKSICQKMPGKHGPDLLRLLSQLLNDFESSSDATVCTLALEGICILCREEIIDLKTTVSFISQKMTSDHRPEVIGAYCLLLAIAPTLKLASDDHKIFVRESLKFLWTKIGSNNHPMVRAKAFEAMRPFSFDDHNLKIMPIEIKSHIRLPFNLIADLPESAPQAPEDVLDYVPGNCWTMLLSSVFEEDVDSVVHFLRCLVRQEVEDKLPRSLFGRTIDGSRKEEPLSYNHLHEKSILKALLNYFQLTREEIGDGFDRRSKVLDILIQELNRPYPPLDWSVLKVSSKDMAKFSQTMAIQAPFSRSACMLTETFISKPESFETIVHMSKKLKILIGCLPEDLITGAFSEALRDLSETYYSNPSSEEFLEDTLSSLGKFLKDPEIPDDVKEPICKILEDFYITFEEGESILSEILLDVVTEMPLANLERLSNPKTFEETNDSQMSRAIKVRSYMAESGKSDTPLSWFNDCIEVLSNEIERFAPMTLTLLFANLASAISRCRVKAPQCCYAWLLELMGMMRSELRGRVESNEKKFDEHKISFLFDVFVVTIAYIAEVDMALADPYKSILTYENRESRMITLPRSVGDFLARRSQQKENPWKRFGAPLAEWLLHLQTTFETQGMYLQKNAISRSLSSFKVDEQYSEATMWGRLVPTI